MQQGWACVCDEWCAQAMMLAHSPSPTRAAVGDISSFIVTLKSFTVSFQVLHALLHLDHCFT